MPAQNGFWVTTLWSGIIGQCLLLFTLPLFKSDLRKASLKKYGTTMAIAVLGFLATLSMTAAYAKNVSISSFIIALPISMILAFAFSVFAPKLLEKHPMQVYVVRFVSVAIMLVAVFNL